MITQPVLDEVQNTDDVLRQLKEMGILTGNGVLEHSRFDALRGAVKAVFEVPWTSITPPMERLLYGISAVQRPRNIVAIGIFCGNTLIWNIGSGCGPGQCYTPEHLVGVEIDPKPAALARENLRRLGVLEHIELLAEDGHAVLERIDYPIDLLYLDAHGPLPGTTGPSTKKIYLTLLERAYDKIPAGGLVLAHDTIPEWFIRQAGEYLEFVRSKRYFRESVSLEPDSQGLEVSVK
jgi:predicted O-methyltransferase YrrM